MLLNDRETANRLRETVANADQASANIDQATMKAEQLVTDLQSRNLPAKVDDTITTARHASQQIDQASQQVNATLTAALGPDHSGETGAQNIRESLSNANLATANLADDTEALKHEFFFRGFFKKRGFYSLDDLTADEYRGNSYFQSPKNFRSWFDAADIFANDGKGNEFISPDGMQRINQVIDNRASSFNNQSLLVEGYSSNNQFLISRSHSLLVKRYLQEHFHMKGSDIASVPLGSTPPRTSGRTSWNGICIVFLVKRK